MEGKSDRVFVSIRGRVLVNVEALNMTESVGNYVKHRRVPMISPKTYSVYFVPAISGESIAHGFQEVLAEEAERRDLRVCDLCKRGIFLKSTTYDVISASFLKDRQLLDWLNIDNETWNKMLQIKEKKKKDKEERQLIAKFESQELPFALESAIVRDCIVEDVGGFLYAEDSFSGFNIGGIKRTSNFYAGYMIPVGEVIENVVIEPQLHSRYALGTPFVRREEEARGQMIYYVELSSAVYTFSFDLDSKYIGRSTFVYEKAGQEVVDDRKKRIEVTLDSIQKFLLEFMFGAKRTRFLPVVDWESLVIAVSDDVWTVPNPNSVNYIERCWKKLEKVNYNTKLFVYINPTIFENTSVLVRKRTEELLNSFYEALEDFKKRLEEKGDKDIIDWENFKKKKLEEFLNRRVEELISSADLNYQGKIQEKYAKMKELLEEKKTDDIKIYDSFEKCVIEAIEEAKKRMD